MQRNIQRAIDRGSGKLGGAALGLLAITTHLWALFPVAALLAASGLVFPTVTSFISQAVGEDDQGAMLGVAASVGSLARIAGPVTAGALFEVGVPVPYVVGAILFGVCLLIAVRSPVAPPALEPAAS